VRNGRIAYVHVGNGSRFQIYTVTATGAHRRPLTSGRRYSSFAPAYSPNGQRIVFVRSFKQTDLWTMKANGSDKRDLTSTAHVDEIDPAWSPDGRQIVFAVESPSADRGIWSMDLRGRSRRRLTAGDDTHPSWSPDGGSIAFQRGDPSTQTTGILVVPAGGGTPANLSTDPASRISSPPGRPTEAESSSSATGGTRSSSTSGS